MSVGDFLILGVFAFLFFVGIIGIFADAVGRGEGEVNVPEIKIRDEYAEKAPTFPHMDFVAFRVLYSVAPEKWSLRDDHASYLGDRINYVYFTNTVELKKYIKFCDEIEQRHNEEMRNRRTLELLRQIQGDIDEYRTSAIEEMKKHLGEEFLSHDQT